MFDFYFYKLLTNGLQKWEGTYFWKGGGCSKAVDIHAAEPFSEDIGSNSGRR